MAMRAAISDVRATVRLGRHARAGSARNACESQPGHGGSIERLGIGVGVVDRLVHPAAGKEKQERA